MTVISSTAGPDTATAHRDADASGWQVPAGTVLAAVLAGTAVILVLVFGVFAGGAEAVVTGSALLGSGAGWAVLAGLSRRRTGRRQRWAEVPAVALAGTGAGLLVVRPGSAALDAAGWVWPAAAVALVVWTVRAIHRAGVGRSRWLLYPLVAALSLAAVGGAVQAIASAREDGRSPAPGSLYDVGGHRLHLRCTGAGSPTVVLENGLGEISSLWAGVVARVSRVTRICAYDRAGQGRSDDARQPQDGVAVATDLHALLARAGEHGPYVLAGHSSGGTLAMTYAARYPDQVSGMVLLDSSSPYQGSAIPSFEREYAVMHRVLPVMPLLARLGVLHLAPAPRSTGLPRRAAEEARSFSTSPRGARDLRDEHAQLKVVFSQAQSLKSLGAKPLAVVTASSNADGTAGWSSAQDRMATLSTESTHWVADTTHVGLLDDASGVADSVRAITEVVTAVRTGSPLPSH